MICLIIALHCLLFSIISVLLGSRVRNNMSVSLFFYLYKDFLYLVGWNIDIIIPLNIRYFFLFTFFIYILSYTSKDQKLREKRKDKKTHKEREETVESQLVNTQERYLRDRKRE